MNTFTEISSLDSTLANGNARNIAFQSFRFVRQCVLLLAFTLFSTITIAQVDSGAEKINAEKININKANSEALQYIPGIGPSKAGAILELRNQRGEFKSMTELLEVKGIGEKLLNNIRQYGTLEGGVSELTQKMIDNPPTNKLSLLHNIAESRFD